MLRIILLGIVSTTKPSPMFSLKPIASWAGPEGSVNGVPALSDHEGDEEHDKDADRQEDGPQRAVQLFATSRDPRVPGNLRMRMGKKVSRHDSKPADEAQEGAADATWIEETQESGVGSVDTGSL